MSSPSPEMVALVDAFGVASVEAVADDPTLIVWSHARAQLTLAIAKLESAQAEAERRLAALVGAVEALDRLAERAIATADIIDSKAPRGAGGACVSGPNSAAINDLKATLDDLRAALPAKDPTP